MKILIVGDSFAASYKGKYLGWANMLEKKYTVTNLAQAGVSEYKIFKQVQSVDVNSFDCVIVSHTSPYRVHTRNSIHNTDLHKDCDLLISDVFGHQFTFDRRIRAAKSYFIHHFDSDYYEDIYQLIREKIDILLKNAVVIDIEKCNIKKLFETNKGTVQHLDEQGNRKMYSTIVSKLNRK